MKKLLLSLLLALPLCGFAQKGMQGIGMSFGNGIDIVTGKYAHSYHAIYQNYLTDRFRISASLSLHNYELVEHMGYGKYPVDGRSHVDIYLKSKSWFMGIEGHYFFNEVRRMRPYSIVGVLLGAYKSKGYDYYSTYEDRENQENLLHEDPTSEFSGGVKLGVGLNYRIRYNLTAQLEIPFYLIYPVPLFAPCFNLVYTF